VADADALFAEHQNRVFRYLRRVVGQSDAARDLTQEVFLRVSRGPIPDGDSDVGRAWLFTIARHLAINHLRDRGRRPSPEPVQEVGRPASQEVGLAISQALAALSELDRDVFLLRESVGLTYAEIAAACGISTEGVRARLHRTRLVLRDRLDLPAAKARGVSLRKPDRPR
jgi:RNA polymerase sigma-70 factor (ECF subfamily)